MESNMPANGMTQNIDKTLPSRWGVPWGIFSEPNAVANNPLKKISVLMILKDNIFIVCLNSKVE